MPHCPCTMAEIAPGVFIKPEEGYFAPDQHCQHCHGKDLLDRGPRDRSSDPPAWILQKLGQVVVLVIVVAVASPSVTALSVQPFEYRQVLRKLRHDSLPPPLPNPFWGTDPLFWPLLPLSLEREVPDFDPPPLPPIEK